MLELDLVYGEASKGVFIAERPIEKVSSMSVVNYQSHADRVWYRISDVLIEGCSPGDTLICNFSFEVTNDLSYGVEISGGLIFTKDEFGVGGVDELTSVSNPMLKPSRSEMITTFGGYNVTPQVAGGSVWHGMHHGMVFRNAAFVVPEGYSGDCYVAAAFYAGGSSFTSNGDQLTVESMCGDLTVVKI